MTISVIGVLSLVGFVLSLVVLVTLISERW